MLCDSAASPLEMVTSSCMVSGDAMGTTSQFKSLIPSCIVSGDFAGAAGEWFPRDLFEACGFVTSYDQYRLWRVLRKENTNL